MREKFSDELKMFFITLFFIGLELSIGIYNRMIDILIWDKGRRGKFYIIFPRLF